MHSYDFNAMVNFLSPTGGVFNAIERLLTDNDAMFQLPFDALPVSFSFQIRIRRFRRLIYRTPMKRTAKPLKDHFSIFGLFQSGVKEAISKNQIPPWYQTKIIAQPGKPVVVNMSIFSFFTGMSVRCDQ